MNEPFKITEAMAGELQDEIDRLTQAPNDAPREVFGLPRIRRGTKRVQDSGSVGEESSNYTEPVETKEVDATDPVNHPKHYTSHPSGVECITVTEWMSFNLGNAVKYIWRAGLKGYQTEDLLKARWYIDRELKRLGAKE